MVVDVRGGNRTTGRRNGNSPASEREVRSEIMAARDVSDDA